MIRPTSLEELASYVEKGKSIFFFTADWCGDCTFIKPVMPEIEAEYPEFRFIEVDRDQFIDVAAEWTIFGIPSFVVTEDGKELGRLVNKNRKTKQEILSFLKDLPSR
ncbi:thioredoxin family protein [Enterococcus rivorum]|uniref:Thiol reductase thioredoxin n=1 Tax=Enterococcus rivorum TaxID=762845 RepID=A0A1E5KUA6_9ENTE|nr:thioredoxin family protein [Enterococcus rivorum]MBP2098958.1 thiol-disulfide isomerase/thioredoxin [Enterococcus rivorum]OEH81446.1 thiol reductase thioredoxin [Enterococcus rivorum]